jgi:D-glycero-D-manno-heptose 1,7-bisphosphate phosphatase
MLAVGPDGRWTVFLDRDGTINRKAPEGEYVRSPEEVSLLDGAADAIARLRGSGARVVVVTNQRGVALGRMSLTDLADVHTELERQLTTAGAALDAIYSCPHDADSCDCRKPEPGLFLRAADDHPAIDLRGSAMVGDSVIDVEAGARLAMTTVLLSDPPRLPDGAVTRPDHLAPTLGDAVDWLLLRAPGRESVPSGNP